MPLANEMPICAECGNRKKYDEFNDRDACMICEPESFVGSPCSVAEDHEYAMETDSPSRPAAMFQIIDGTEKYKVVDLVTGGESFHDEKLDAYRMCHVLVNVLHHNYRLEVR